VMGEISRRLNAQDLAIEHSPVSAERLGHLIGRIQDGTISNNAAKQVFEALWTLGPDEHGPQARVDELIESLGLKQMADTGALEAMVAEVLAANPKSVDEFKAGKEKAFNALVGQVMKASKGKAPPTVVNELLKKALGAA
jgi:aspartyl-tRNA(Asn)/glutamyl-tRNA(Gln) amidotransferase subunit B